MLLAVLAQLQILLDSSTKSPLRAAGQFSSGVGTVEVYVTVTDRAGAPVSGLSRDAFTVYEDGEPQPITAFAAGEFPLSIALAVDRSFSMWGKHLSVAKAAARAFLAELGPEDRSMVIAIGSEVELVAPSGTDRRSQRQTLELDPWGSTRLHDAIMAAIDLVQSERGRRALVLLSDGDDKGSEATAAQALARARGADVLVYPIAIGRSRPQPVFAELAVLTGGRSFDLSDARRLGPTLTAVARELRHQYLIGYTPARAFDIEPTRWRSITIKVNRPDARVRARDGYYPEGRR